MAYKGPRNRGGWPARPKTVFDVAAVRRAARASDRLHSAIMHIHQTVAGDLYDVVADRGDRGSSDALKVLTDAMKRVNAEARKYAELAQ